MLGLTGPSLSADDRLALEHAGLANADTADDGRYFVLISALSNMGG